MGGLSRKALQIKSLAREVGAPPLLIDSGNLLFKQPTIGHGQEIITASALLDISNKMAYEAVAVGPNDIAAGSGFLKSKAAAALPWLSANLRDSANMLLFKPARIVERNGLKIGIIGLTGPIAASSLEVVRTDWRKALKEQIAILTKECGLLVVLSNLPMADNDEITRDFPQVNILITANRELGDQPAKLVNHTITTQTMNQGKSLGVLNLKVIPGKGWIDSTSPNNSPTGTDAQYSSFTSSLIALTKDLKEDDEIAGRVAKVKEEILQYNQQASSALAQDRTAANQEKAEQLAGASRCQECHASQSQFWQTTAHAHSYQVLAHQRQNFNLDCLPCHVTQARLPTATTPRPAALFNLPRDLQAVGCEVCHGPALAHANAPGQVKPRRLVTEAICRSCHTDDHDLLFDYQKKLGKVSCPATIVP